ncbi:MlaC/ttg2D family ABC transporter substrate-binding protein [Nioella sediminis]|jgi:phospholipid transport system substrate-binding protein|uniref:MlaC/ttg2D family ABC transporter substrate-binding protein n=1 Tax=Nioella sediminis TaxID=1912092 RepID=UPI0008FD6F10|nr:ABC transporter substrate-binding protein [Nioella sediminis]TBX28409.1 ABC transporter [Roseovarius sp. JS7-11]
MPSKFSLTRRAFLGLTGASAAALALPERALALTVGAAQTLVERLVSDLYDAINSGGSEARMFSDFAGLLDRYADMPIIAQSVLGVDWRRASNAQRSAFVDAFSGYISRKYGSRFRELIGGQIEVTGARAIRNFFEVTSVARLRGEAPFDVIWLVSDGSGQARVFNLIIQGINLRTTEAEEVGAMLDRNRGDLDAMIADLRNAS